MTHAASEQITATTFLQSDLGTGPAGWRLSSVEQMGSILTGKALASSAPGQQRPYLRTKNVFDGRIDLDDVLTMPMTDGQFDQFEVLPGDVLLNEGQSLQLVGRCALYRGEYGDRCAMQNQLIRFRAGSGVSPEFAAHLFRFCQQTGIFARVALQTTSIAHLGSSRFGRLVLTWPPSEEQRAIAAALSDVDALISGVDKLIAKKRSIRFSVIQDSFGDSGRYSRANREEPVASRRAFSEVALVTLREVSKSITVGFVGSMSKLFAQDGVPLLRGQNVQAGRLDFSALKFITKGTHERWSKSRLEPGDVVIVRVGYPGTACTIPAGLGEMNAASLIVVKPNEDLLEPRYLEYFLNSPAGAAQIANSLVGGAQQVLNIGIAARLPILIPPIREQHDIVSILSDIDAEITALERRRNKTTALKLGMMQQLLTGSIRLHKPEVVA